MLLYTPHLIMTRDRFTDIHIDLELFLDHCAVHPSVYHPVKRRIDILGACVGLILTAMLLIPIAIALYLDDPGPIFYRQTRCGLRGKPFSFWKFRSMVFDADALKHQVPNQAKGQMFKNKDDPRITRVGKILRRTSLDELPQFWNVLRGEMSLVGTRPPTLDEVAKYQRHHWLRLAVRPGMTGEWQVRGRAEVLDFEAVVRFDLDYLCQWSILHDLELLCKTLLIVLRMKGAY